MNYATLNTPPPFVQHSATSAAAADAIRPKAPTKRAQVLAYIKSCHRFGATDDELVWLMPMPPNTLRPRRVELCQAKLIVDSGRTRKTIWGKDATVWVENVPEYIA